MQGGAAGRVRVAGARGCYWEGKSGQCFSPKTARLKYPKNPNNLWSSCTLLCMYSITAHYEVSRGFNSPGTSCLE